MKSIKVFLIYLPTRDIMTTFSLSFTPLFGQILLAHEVTELYLHTKGKKKNI